jgi:glucosylceramidase
LREYFVRFLQSYAAEGVKINATAVRNEVDTNHNSLIPACLWSQEDESRFVATYLGPILERASLDTKIWTLDHNHNLWSRVLDQLSQPGVSRYVDSIAWRAYDGTVDAMMRVHEAFSNKHAQWTGGGAVITSPDFETDWSKWSAPFTGVLRNWGMLDCGLEPRTGRRGEAEYGPGNPAAS